MLLVGLGPEERQERVAPVEPARSGRSQVAQEGDSLGLSQESSRFTPGLRSRGDSAKQPELEGRESGKQRTAAVIHAARIQRCGRDGIVLVIQRSPRPERRQRRIPHDFTLGSRWGNAREIH
jgi:hypothetical protein